MLVIGEPAAYWETHLLQRCAVCRTLQNIVVIISLKKRAFGTLDALRTGLVRFESGGKVSSAWVRIFSWHDAFCLKNYKHPSAHMSEPLSEASRVEHIVVAPCYPQSPVLHPVNEQSSIDSIFSETTNILTPKYSNFFPLLTRPDVRHCSQF